MHLHLMPIDSVCDHWFGLARWSSSCHWICSHAMHRNIWLSFCQENRWETRLLHNYWSKKQCWAYTSLGTFPLLRQTTRISCTPGLWNNSNAGSVKEICVRIQEEMLCIHLPWHMWTPEARGKQTTPLRWSPMFILSLFIGTVFVIIDLDCPDEAVLAIESAVMQCTETCDCPFVRRTDGKQGYCIAIDACHEVHDYITAMSCRNVENQSYPCFGLHSHSTY